MKKVFISLVICLLFTSSISFAQQWSGSSTTADPIYRNGNVVIQNEGSGFIVDEGVNQRVGFMKYPTKYGGIWRLSNAFLEIGRVNGTLQSPTGFITDLFISENGNFGIGTMMPGSFKLAVEGKIGAREIQVTTVNPWPDYVFKKGYQLMSLSSIEKFVKQNSHLPGVPSAEAVKKEGIDVAKMDAVLLQKIEELTLHLITLNKEVDKLKKQNASLKQKIEKQKRK